MEKLKKGFRIFVFILLILLSFVGIGLPILLMNRDRFDAFNERIDEEPEKRQKETYQVEVKEGPGKL